MRRLGLGERTGRVALGATGMAVIVGSLSADALGLGGAPGLGWKQLLGLIVGALTLGIAILLSPRGRALGADFTRFLARFTPFFVALAVYLLAFAAMDLQNTAGDEPHYILMAQSLVRDGDVDLRNDYASSERTLAAASTFPLEPHALRYDGDPELFSFHSLGLAILLVPAVWLDGVTLARLLMVIVTALLAHQLYRLLGQLGLTRRWGRWLAWIGTALCVPVLAFSNQIHPEIPAALLIVVALRIVLLPSARPVALVAGGVACALLPWLHYRYLLFAIALVCALAYTAFRRAESLRERRLGLAAAVVPLVASLGLMAGAHEHWYGNPLPHASAEPFEHLGVGKGGWAFLYTYFLGDLLNPGYGWFPYAPLHVAGVAALGCLVWRFRAGAIVGVAVVAGYMLLIASVGQVGAGYTFPARYQLVVVPLIAIPLAVLMQHVRVAVLPLTVLLVLTAAVSAAAVLHAGELYPGPDPAEARIPIVRSAQGLFPRVIPAATSFELEPSDHYTQTGRIEGMEATASQASGDPPGFLLYGGYRVLEAGEYRARFTLAEAEGTRTVQEIESPARVDVVTSEQVLAERAVRASDLSASRLEPVSLTFTLGDREVVEPRVLFTGVGSVRAGAIYVTRTDGSGESTSTFRDWPRVLAWLAATALVGAVFLRIARQAGRR